MGAKTGTNTKQDPRFKIPRKSDLDKRETPFYYYDLALLQETLKACKEEAGAYQVHYALKANVCVPVVEAIRAMGYGADCVSGAEVRFALDQGFAPDKVVFAGVGKSPAEMDAALEAGIGCFNVESREELELLAARARVAGRKAPVALRVNPQVDARTHKYITTGLEENKFGIPVPLLGQALEAVRSFQDLVDFKGLHFHIGSQIESPEPFRELCLRVQEIQAHVLDQGWDLGYLNLGGGLGVNYSDPDVALIPDFRAFFEIFRKDLPIRSGQEVHFELGRALVAQCGALISRVLYVKQGLQRQFAILDAGMTELLRPALYQARHKVEPWFISEDRAVETYDVVGPVCESSDIFGKAMELPRLESGDIVAIRTTGAYGAVMSSGYNLRKAGPEFFAQ